MVQDKPDTGTLKKYKAILYPYRGDNWEWHGGGVARAVIEFKKDINHLIPLIGKSVEGCAYNPEANVAGFQVNNLRVVIGQNRMNIYGTDDKKIVQNVIDWIIDKIGENVNNRQVESNG